jgi:hypothetical protein
LRLAGPGPILEGETVECSKETEPALAGGGREVVMPFEILSWDSRSWNVCDLCDTTRWVHTAVDENERQWHVCSRCLAAMVHDNRIEEYEVEERL